MPHILLPAPHLVVKPCCVQGDSCDAAGAAASPYQRLFQHRCVFSTCSECDETLSCGVAVLTNGFAHQVKAALSAIDLDDVF